MTNNELQYVYKKKNDSCSCNGSKANMMRCKHDICLNKKFNLTKIGNCWLQRKNITQSSNKGLYNSPTIVRYTTMVVKFQNEQMLHDEFYISDITDVDNGLMKNDESQKN